MSRVYSDLPPKYENSIKIRYKISELFKFN